MGKSVLRYFRVQLVGLQCTQYRCNVLDVDVQVWAVDEHVIQVDGATGFYVAHQYIIHYCLECSRSTLKAQGHDLHVEVPERQCCAGLQGQLSLGGNQTPCPSK